MLGHLKQNLDEQNTSVSTAYIHNGSNRKELNLRCQQQQAFSFLFGTYLDAIVHINSSVILCHVTIMCLIAQLEKFDDINISFLFPVFFKQ